MFHGLLIVALVAFTRDLTGGGGVQAWTYNYSVSPTRNWDSARLWCQQHFTDMVAIQNRLEIDFLNQMLPFNPTYYWIGIRKLVGVWTWVGTRKTLSEEAENWAKGEPNNIHEDCVEVYIKRAEDTAKWNDERCSKRKGTVCYTASCSEKSCSVHADCVETIGNYSCHCHPGFQGPRCEEAIACKTLLDPEQGSLNCNHSHGSHRFNSSCWFHCDLGYRLVGAPRLQCQANGHWDHPAPLCQVEQCPALTHAPVGGSMNCSHCIAPYSYNSSCEVRCDEGFELSGQNPIRCDPTGQWTAKVPTCAVITCSPLSAPTMGNMTCMDTLATFSFGSLCNFTCREGYSLTGADTLTCLAAGQWNKRTPTCTVVRCNSLKAPTHGSVQCHDPLGEYSYGSTCTMQCEEGFDLIGANSTQCSSQGNWSHALPVCQAKRCHNITSPLHGSLTCSDPHGSFRFGSQCVSTCKEGFLLNGTADTMCTSLGMWSAEVPSCLAMKCKPLTAPAHGSLSCSDPHGLSSFGSRCVLTCTEGFLLNGTADTECTSLGMWTREVPRCLARQCPLLPNAPNHGWMNCSHPYSPFSHRSLCSFACKEGFWLRGEPTMQCNSGLWSQELPTCQAKRCHNITSPLHGSLTCSDPHGSFRFGSQCVSTCKEGFLLNGTADTMCTSLGMWSAEVPSCLAMKCKPLTAPAHGSLSCSDPHGLSSFGSRCVLTCTEGFLLNGTADTECTSLGMWTREVPRCLARQCPLLPNAPNHGWMNCSHPYSPFSHRSLCSFACKEGFWLRGEPTMQCNSGLWSQELPTCQAVQCEAIPASSSPLSVNCSHPLGNFSFGSHCLFSCEEGYSMNGTEAVSCSSTGSWSGNFPGCTEEGLTLGSAMLMYTGVGAVSAVAVLASVGLALLIVKQCTKKEGIVTSGNSLWEERENPAFES